MTAESQLSTKGIIGDGPEIYTWTVIDSLLQVVLHGHSLSLHTLWMRCHRPKQPTEVSGGVAAVCSLFIWMPDSPLRTQAVFHNQSSIFK